MDARARLRAYLEQRRELGESEFVLDSMSVEEALSAIDKLRAAEPPGAVQRRIPNARPARETVRPIVAVQEPEAVAPSAVSTGRIEQVAAVPPTPAKEIPHADFAGDGGTTKREIVHGIVVGNANGTLFEQSPFHSSRTLGSLAKLIEDCTRCPLYSTARNAVPGDGDPEADFMCVGEAPGANEDESGHPFVGQAGGLLTKILAAIDLTREQVFITNVLKHRPPGNRNPQPNEVEACSPYLVRQIQMVKPKVILALGTFAAQTLLETKTPIGKLRGAVHRYYGIPLIVTYHPAALLRNPAWKRPTWEDVKLARHILDTAKS
ncbi:MAG: uracil-DNA glycosylase [Gemmatimonadota bacterium]|nr:uracil-DNA glycosylase [Gemmatimonadota bacterium]